MRSRTTLFRGVAIGSLLTLLVAGAIGLAAMGEGTLSERARRLVFLGRPLVHVLRPTPGQQISFGGVEVEVGFSGHERVAVDTFRCLLNNRDVTHLLTLGSNGAQGAILGLIEGENRIRIEVFGRGWWGARYFQDTRTVVFQVRPYPNLDRALLGPLLWDPARLWDPAAGGRGHPPTLACGSLRAPLRGACGVVRSAPA